VYAAVCSSRLCFVDERGVGEVAEVNETVTSSAVGASSAVYGMRCLGSLMSFALLSASPPLLFIHPFFVDG
jgi:hypothetical protein